MIEEGSKKWKDLVVKHQFLRDFQGFFKSSTKSETPELNDLQLKSLPDISNHDKNLLICAPTGSGKTLVFDMIILNCLYKNYLKVNKDYTNFKVIYMAPTQAVCEEKKTEFEALNNNQKGINLKVFYLESNMYRKQNEAISKSIRQNNIIICTPQMCNYIIRKFSDIFIKKLDLFLVDEIHMIGSDSRGPNLEIIMDRLLSMQRRVGNLRIACVSASVSNQKQVAQWLKAVPVESFERRVKIKLISRGHLNYNPNVQYQVRNKIIINQLLNAIQQIQIAFKLAKQTKKGNENYLIFCTSRADTKTNCTKFIQIKKKAEFQFVRDPPSITPVELEEIFKKYEIENDDLKECLRQRMGYHHAALSKNEKDLVMYLMRQGWITVLFSTSTLAQGVNLPVKAVIFMMLARWEVDDEEILYTWGQIDQMVGRVGRNKGDKFGYCCFLDKQEYVRKVQQTYDQNEERFKFTIEPIQSNFQDKFEDFLFFEAAFRGLDLRNQQNVKQLTDHFKQSLWFIQNKAIILFNSINIEQDLRKQIAQKNTKFQEYDLNSEEIRRELFENLQCSVKTYYYLFDELKNSDGVPWITHDKFLETVCSIDQIAQVYRYTRQDNMGDIRAKFKTTYKVQSRNKENPISSSIASRNKAIILIKIILSGKMQILERYPVTKLEACKILKSFKNACNLVQLIQSSSQKYKQNNLIDPGALFFCQLYLKYCSMKSKNIEQKEWSFEKECSECSSHMNIPKCFELLKIDGKKLGKNKQLKQVIKQSTKYSGFFQIKEYFQQRASQKFQTEILTTTQQIINSFRFRIIKIYHDNCYKIIANFLDNKNFKLYLFKFEQGMYIYQENVFDLKKLSFLPSDTNKYLFVVIFTKIIGLDSVLQYESGKFTRVSLFQNQGLDQLSQQQGSQSEDEEKKQLPEDKEDVQNSNISQNQKRIKS